MGANELVSKQKKFAANGKLPSFRLGINKFSMFTYDEKVEKFTGLTREARERRRRMLDTKAAKIHKRNVNLVTNSTVDWRNTPLVGPVKNQGGCGQYFNDENRFYGKKSFNFIKIHDQRSC